MLHVSSWLSATGQFNTAAFRSLALLLGNVIGTFHLVFFICLFSMFLHFLPSKYFNGSFPDGCVKIAPSALADFPSGVLGDICSASVTEKKERK